MAPAIAWLLFDIKLLNYSLTDASIVNFQRALAWRKDS